MKFRGWPDDREKKPRKTVEWGLKHTGLQPPVSSSFRLRTRVRKKVHVKPRIPLRFNQWGPRNTGLALPRPWGFRVRRSGHLKVKTFRTFRSWGPQHSGLALPRPWQFQVRHAKHHKIRTFRHTFRSWGPHNTGLSSFLVPKLLVLRARRRGFARLPRSHLRFTKWPVFIGPGPPGGPPLRTLAIMGVGL